MLPLSNPSPLRHLPSEAPAAGSPPLRVHVRYRDVRAMIWNADLLLMRPVGLPGRLIAKLSGSEYSHAAMAGWWGSQFASDADLMCLEVLQWIGGRATAMASQVRSYPGVIDVYRPRLNGRNREQAFALMRRLSSVRYDWRGLAKAAFTRRRKVSAEGNRFYTPHDHDWVDYNAPRFCSAAVGLAYGFGPQMAPGDFVHAGLFDYRFTLTW